MTEAPQTRPGPILELKDLRTYFFTGGSTIRTVNGVDLALERRQTLGLVGESGCGKSVTAMSIMRLIKSPPGKIVSGQILLRQGDGAPVDIAQLKPDGAKMREIRGGDIAMVFQEPMTSLNPLYTVGAQITEAVRQRQKVSRRAALDQAHELLQKVQLGDAKRRLGEYPHQLSGDERQRVTIALALSCSPSVLIADEPASALDAAAQPQIFDLMRRSQGDSGSSTMLITQNLGLVSQMADSVAVMCLGKIVECADTRELFRRPLHPYTAALLSAAPAPGKTGRSQLAPIPDALPSPPEPSRGCPFAARCQHTMAICREAHPPLRSVGPGHQVACWLHETP
jgi:oligopeptide/dipeptide ABC transporter ATP-binding protein